MRQIRLDQHIHSSLSDGRSSDQEIIDKIRSSKLDFAVITDHDNINHRLQDKIRGIGISTCSGTEISVLGHDDKEVHILLYAKRFGNKIKDILESSKEGRKGVLMKKIQTLNDSFFSIDEDHLLDAVRAKAGESYMFGRSDIAEYLFSIAQHRQRIFEIIGRRIDEETFCERYLEEYDGWGGLKGKMQCRYLPSLHDLGKAIEKENTVVSLAHPQNIFKNTQDFQRNIMRYIDSGINALEVNATAHRSWEHEIIRCRNEHSMILTFGSDYHGGEHLHDGKHSDIGDCNPELSPNILSENLKLFKNIINS